MFLCTAGDLAYEIDTDVKRWCRIEGGARADWQDYHHLTPSTPELGAGLFIDFGDGRYAMTGLVDGIQGEAERDADVGPGIARLLGARIERLEEVAHPPIAVLTQADIEALREQLRNLTHQVNRIREDVSAIRLKTRWI